MQTSIEQSKSRYLDGDYLAENPDWHADDAPWKADHALVLLKEAGISPKSIAEVGSGSGAFLELLQRAFPASVADGYEISPQAFAFCSRRETGQLRFHNGTPFDRSEHFDLMSAIDVFEHVEDPFSFVRGMAAMSSYQLFHIPLDMSSLSVAREWPITDARSKIGHLHYYTRGTAIAFLQDCGLEIVGERYTAWAIDQSYKSFKKRLAAVPRRIAHAMAPHLTVRLVGGWSLMVLTRPAR